MKASDFDYRDYKEHEIRNNVHGGSCKKRRAVVETRSRDFRLPNFLPRDADHYTDECAAEVESRIEDAKANKRPVEFGFSNDEDMEQLDGNRRFDQTYCWAVDHAPKIILLVL